MFKEIEHVLSRERGMLWSEVQDIFVFWVVDICGICKFIESFGFVLQEKSNDPPRGRKVMAHFTGKMVDHFIREIGHTHSIKFSNAGFSPLPYELS